MRRYIAILVAALFFVLVTMPVSAEKTSSRIQKTNYATELGKDAWALSGSAFALGIGFAIGAGPVGIATLGIAGAFGGKALGSYLNNRLKIKMHMK